jgi:ABC-type multidrug transport system ATPase subunit
VTVVGELLVGIQAVREGRLPGVQLAVLALTPLAAFELTNSLPAAAKHLVRGLHAVDRLRALEKLPHPSVAWGNKDVIGHTLKITHAEARWPTAGEPTLQDISLSLTPGRRIAVIGESGAGKSTLIAALAGFLATDRGAVTYAGVPLTDLDENAFRRHVVVCAQDDHLFDTTIRNNLLVARPDATDTQLMNALRQARLSTWVNRQPHGLGTTVGDRAGQLSGGERQRLALARALLADPAVLLLDEPTAHLDDPTAAELTRDILTATRGRATLLVTHRLEGLADLDEIIVLSHGKLTGLGLLLIVACEPGAGRGRGDEKDEEDDAESGGSDADDGGVRVVEAGEDQEAAQADGDHAGPPRRLPEAESGEDGQQREDQADDRHRAEPGHREDDRGGGGHGHQQQHDDHSENRGRRAVHSRNLVRPAIRLPRGPAADLRPLPDGPSALTAARPGRQG